jgi:hypothetical protein
MNGPGAPIAVFGAWPYILCMRKGSTLTIILFDFALAFCVLALIVALIAVGVGLVALCVLFASLSALTLLTFFPSISEPVFVRRVSRRRQTRAPPLF